MNSPEEIIELLRVEFGSKDFNRQDFVDLMVQNKVPYNKYYPLTSNSSPIKVSRGIFNVSKISASNSNSKKTQNNVTKNNNSSANNENNVTFNKCIEICSVDSKESLIPEKFANYIETGIYSTVAKVVNSRQFCPVFISGLSGNGKTLSVLQACAKAKRELYRVNITIETDEDDLLGGFRLVNGETIWFDGPVVKAMKTGAILLLDEIDLGSNKLMCLQPILEGRGVFLKKIGQFVSPKDGFNIIATANTKGQGNETGKFVGTNILNEAFLDRFYCLLQQEYPSVQAETKILKNQFKDFGYSDDYTDKLANDLALWAYGTRKTYDAGGVSDVISTRRLSQIANMYNIFVANAKDDIARNKAITQAIDICTARFDSLVQESFNMLWQNISGCTNPSDIAELVNNTNVITDRGE